MGGATPLSASSLRAHSDLNPRKASLGALSLSLSLPSGTGRRGKRGKEGGALARMDGGSGYKP